MGTLKAHRSNGRLEEPEKPLEEVTLELGNGSGHHLKPWREM